MWTPTRRVFGEGGTDREEPGAGARQRDNHRAPIRSTGVVGTARRKGNQRNWGRLGMVAESRTAKALVGCRTIWESERVRSTDEARVMLDRAETKWPGLIPG